MLGSISTALSGLLASSKRVEASASNIANVSTGGALDPKDGQQAYTPLDVAQETTGTGGVKADFIPRDPAFVPAFDPDSPFANEDGFIATPNVSLTEEIVNLNLAEITYKANVSVIKTSTEMSDELFRAFDEEV